MLCCVSGCVSRKQSSDELLAKNFEYVIDTTLQQEYTDVEPSTEKVVYPITVESVNQVIDIIKPIIQSCVKEGILQNEQTKVCINLVDTIWLVRTNVVMTDNDVFYLGGAIYLEINKTDGGILKFVVEE